MTERADKACLRCRELKKKCLNDGSINACQRCIEDGTRCHYKTYVDFSQQISESIDYLNRQLDQLQAEIDEFISLREKMQVVSFTAVSKHNKIQIQTQISTYNDLYQALQIFEDYCR